MHNGRDKRLRTRSTGKLIQNGSNSKPLRTKPRRKISTKPPKVRAVSKFSLDPHSPFDFISFQSVSIGTIDQPSHSTPHLKFSTNVLNSDTISTINTPSLPQHSNLPLPHLNSNKKNFLNNLFRFQLKNKLITTTKRHKHYIFNPIQPLKHDSIKRKAQRKASPTGSKHQNGWALENTKVDPRQSIKKLLWNLVNLKIREKEADHATQQQQQTSGTSVQDSTGTTEGDPEKDQSEDLSPKYNEFYVDLDLPEDHIDNKGKPTKHSPSKPNTSPPTGDNNLPDNNDDDEDDDDDGFIEIGDDDSIPDHQKVKNTYATQLLQDKMDATHLYNTTLSALDNTMLAVEYSNVIRGLALDPSQNDGDIHFAIEELMRSMTSAQKIYTTLKQQILAQFGVLSEENLPNAAIEILYYLRQHFIYHPTPQEWSQLINLGLHVGLVSFASQLVQTMYKLHTSPVRNPNQIISSRQRCGIADHFLTPDEDLGPVVGATTMSPNGSNQKQKGVNKYVLSRRREFLLGTGIEMQETSLENPSNVPLYLKRRSLRVKRNDQNVQLFQNLGASLTLIDLNNNQNQSGQTLDTTKKTTGTQTTTTTTTTAPVDQTLAQNDNFFQFELDANDIKMIQKVFGTANPFLELDSAHDLSDDTRLTIFAPKLAEKLKQSKRRRKSKNRQNGEKNTNPDDFSDFEDDDLSDIDTNGDNEERLLRKQQNEHKRTTTVPPKKLNDLIFNPHIPTLFSPTLYFVLQNTSKQSPTFAAQCLQDLYPMETHSKLPVHLVEHIINQAIKPYRPIQQKKYKAAKKTQITSLAQSAQDAQDGITRDAQDNQDSDDDDDDDDDNTNVDDIISNFNTSFSQSDSKNRKGSTKMAGLPPNPMPRETLYSITHIIHSLHRRKQPIPASVDLALLIDSATFHQDVDLSLKLFYFGLSNAYSLAFASQYLKGTKGKGGIKSGDENNDPEFNQVFENCSKLIKNGVNNYSDPETIINEYVSNFRYLYGDSSSEGFIQYIAKQPKNISSTANFFDQTLANSIQIDPDAPQDNRPSSQNPDKSQEQQTRFTWKPINKIKRNEMNKQLPPIPPIGHLNIGFFNSFLRSMVLNGEHSLALHTYERLLHNIHSSVQAYDLPAMFPTKTRKPRRKIGKGKNTKSVQNRLNKSTSSANEDQLDDHEENNDVHDDNDSDDSDDSDIDIDEIRTRPTSLLNNFLLKEQRNIFLKSLKNDFVPKTIEQQRKILQKMRWAKIKNIKIARLQQHQQQRHGSDPSHDKTTQKSTTKTKFDKVQDRKRKRYGEHITPLDSIEIQSDMEDNSTTEPTDKQKQDTGTSNALIVPMSILTPNSDTVCVVLSALQHQQRWGDMLTVFFNLDQGTLTSPHNNSISTLTNRDIVHLTPKQLDQTDLYEDTLLYTAVDHQKRQFLQNWYQKHTKLIQKWSNSSSPDQQSQHDIPDLDSLVKTLNLEEISRLDDTFFSQKTSNVSIHIPKSLPMLSLVAEACHHLGLSEVANGVQKMGLYMLAFQRRLHVIEHVLGYLDHYFNLYKTRYPHNDHFSQHYGDKMNEIKASYVLQAQNALHTVQNNPIFTLVPQSLLKDLSLPAQFRTWDIESKFYPELDSVIETDESNASGHLKIKNGRNLDIIMDILHNTQLPNNLGTGSQWYDFSTTSSSNLDSFSSNLDAFENDLDLDNKDKKFLKNAKMLLGYNSEINHLYTQAFNNSANYDNAHRVVQNVNQSINNTRSQAMTSPQFDLNALLQGDSQTISKSLNQDDPNRRITPPNMPKFTNNLTIDQMSLLNSQSHRELSQKQSIQAKFAQKLPHISQSPIGAHLLTALHQYQSTQPVVGITLPHYHTPPMSFAQPHDVAVSQLLRDLPNLNPNDDIDQSTLANKNIVQVDGIVLSLPFPEVFKRVDKRLKAYFHQGQTNFHGSLSDLGLFETKSGTNGTESGSKSTPQRSTVNPATSLLYELNQELKMREIMAQNKRKHDQQWSLQFSTPQQVLALLNHESKLRYPNLASSDRGLGSGLAGSRTVTSPQEGDYSTYLHLLTRTSPRVGLSDQNTPLKAMYNKIIPKSVLRNLQYQYISQEIGGYDRYNGLSGGLGGFKVGSGRTAGELPYNAQDLVLDFYGIIMSYFAMSIGRETQLSANRSTIGPNDDSIVSSNPYHKHLPRPTPTRTASTPQPNYLATLSDTFSTNFYQSATRFFTQQPPNLTNLEKNRLFLDDLTTHFPSPLLHRVILYNISARYLAVEITSANATLNDSKSTHSTNNKTDSLGTDSLGTDHHPSLLLERLRNADRLLCQHPSILSISYDLDNKHIFHADLSLNARPSLPPMAPHISAIVVPTPKQSSRTQRESWEQNDDRNGDHDGDDADQFDADDLDDDDIVTSHSANTTKKKQLPKSFPLSPTPSIMIIVPPTPVQDFGIPLSFHGPISNQNEQQPQKPPHQPSQQQSKGQNSLTKPESKQNLRNFRVIESDYLSDPSIAPKLLKKNAPLLPPGLPRQLRRHLVETHSFVMNIFSLRNDAYSASIQALSHGTVTKDLKQFTNLDSVQGSKSETQAGNQNETAKKTDVQPPTGANGLFNTGLMPSNDDNIAVSLGNIKSQDIQTNHSSDQDAQASTKKPKVHHVLEKIQTRTTTEINAYHRTLRDEENNDNSEVSGELVPISPETALVSSMNHNLNHRATKMLEIITQMKIFASLFRYLIETYYQLSLAPQPPPPPMMKNMKYGPHGNQHLLGNNPYLQLGFGQTPQSSSPIEALLQDRKGLDLDVGRSILDSHGTHADKNFQQMMSPLMNQVKKVLAQAQNQSQNALNPNQTHHKKNGQLVNFQGHFPTVLSDHLRKNTITQLLAYPTPTKQLVLYDENNRPLLTHAVVEKVLFNRRTVHLINSGLIARLMPTITTETLLFTSLVSPLNHSQLTLLKHAMQRKFWKDISKQGLNMMAQNRAQAHGPNSQKTTLTPQEAMRQRQFSEEAQYIRAKKMNFVVRLTDEQRAQIDKNTKTNANVINNMLIKHFQSLLTRSVGSFQPVAPTTIFALPHLQFNIVKRIAKNLSNSAQNTKINTHHQSNVQNQNGKMATIKTSSSVDSGNQSPSTRSAPALPPQQPSLAKLLKSTLSPSNTASATSILLSEVSTERMNDRVGVIATNPDQNVARFGLIYPNLGQNFPIQAVFDGDVDEFQQVLESHHEVKVVTDLITPKGGQKTGSKDNLDDLDHHSPTAYSDWLASRYAFQQTTSQPHDKSSNSITTPASIQPSVTPTTKYGFIFSRTNQKIFTNLRVEPPAIAYPGFALTPALDLDLAMFLANRQFQPGSEHLARGGTGTISKRKNRVGANSAETIDNEQDQSGSTLIHQSEPATDQLWRDNLPKAPEIHSKIGEYLLDFTHSAIFPLLFPKKIPVPPTITSSFLPQKPLAYYPQERTIVDYFTALCSNNTQPQNKLNGQDPNMTSPLNDFIEVGPPTPSTVPQTFSQHPSLATQGLHSAFIRQTPVLGVWSLIFNISNINSLTNTFISSPDHFKQLSSTIYDPKTRTITIDPKDARLVPKIGQKSIMTGQQKKQNEHSGQNSLVFSTDTCRDSALHYTDHKGVTTALPSTTPSLHYFHTGVLIAIENSQRDKSNPSQQPLQSNINSPNNDSHSSSTKPSKMDRKLAEMDPNSPHMLMQAPSKPGTGAEGQTGGIDSTLIGQNASISQQDNPQQFGFHNLLSFFHSYHTLHIINNKSQHRALLQALGIGGSGSDPSQPSPEDGQNTTDINYLKIPFPSDTQLATLFLTRLTPTPTTDSISGSDRNDQNQRTPAQIPLDNRVLVDSITHKVLLQHQAVPSMHIPKLTKEQKRQIKALAIENGEAFDEHDPNHHAMDDNLDPDEEKLFQNRKNSAKTADRKEDLDDVDFDWSDAESGFTVDPADRGPQGATYKEGKPNEYNLLTKKEQEEQEEGLDTHPDPQVVQVRQNSAILRRKQRHIGLLETPSLGSLVKMIKHRVLEVSDQDLDLLERIPELKIALRMVKLLSQSEDNGARQEKVFDMISKYDEERAKLINQEIARCKKDGEMVEFGAFSENLDDFGQFNNKINQSTTGIGSSPSIYDVINKAKKATKRLVQYGQKQDQIDQNSAPIDPMFDQNFVPNLNDWPGLFEHGIETPAGVDKHHNTTNLHSIQAITLNFATLLSRNNTTNVALHDVTSLYLFLLGLEQSLLKSSVAKMKKIEHRVQNSSETSSTPKSSTTAASVDKQSHTNKQEQNDTNLPENKLFVTPNSPTSPLSQRQINSVSLYQQTRTDITPVHFQDTILKTLFAHVETTNSFSSKNPQQDSPLDHRVTSSIFTEFVKMGLIRGQYPSFSIADNSTSRNQPGKSEPPSSPSSPSSPSNTNTTIAKSLSHAQIISPQSALFLDLHGTDFRLQPHLVTHQFEQIYHCYAIQRLTQLARQMESEFSFTTEAGHENGSKSGLLSRIFAQSPTIQSLRAFDDSKLQMPTTNNTSPGPSSSQPLSTTPVQPQSSSQKPGQSPQALAKTKNVLANLRQKQDLKEKLEKDQLDQDLAISAQKHSFASRNLSSDQLKTIFGELASQDKAPLPSFNHNSSTAPDDQIPLTAFASQASAMYYLPHITLGHALQHGVTIVTGKMGELDPSNNERSSDSQGSVKLHETNGKLRPTPRLVVPVTLSQYSKALLYPAPVCFDGDDDGDDTIIEQGSPVGQSSQHTPLRDGLPTPNLHYPAQKPLIRQVDAKFFKNGNQIASKNNTDNKKPIDDKSVDGKVFYQPSVILNWLETRFENDFNYFGKFQYDNSPHSLTFGLEADQPVKSHKRAATHAQAVQYGALHQLVTSMHESYKDQFERVNFDQISDKVSSFTSENDSTQQVSSGSFANNKPKRAPVDQIFEHTVSTLFSAFGTAEVLNPLGETMNRGDLEIFVKNQFKQSISSQLLNPPHQLSDRTTDQITRHDYSQYDFTILLPVDTGNDKNDKTNYQLNPKLVQLMSELDLKRSYFHKSHSANKFHATQRMINDQSNVNTNVESQNNTPSAQVTSPTVITPPTPPTPLTTTDTTATPLRTSRQRLGGQSSPPQLNHQPVIQQPTPQTKDEPKSNQHDILAHAEQSHSNLLMQSNPLYLPGFPYSSTHFSNPNQLYSLWNFCTAKELVTDATTNKNTAKTLTIAQNHQNKISIRSSPGSANGTSITNEEDAIIGQLGNMIQRFNLLTGMQP